MTAFYGFQCDVCYQKKVRWAPLLEGVDEFRDEQGDSSRMRRTVYPESKSPPGVQNQLVTIHNVALTADNQLNR